MSDRDRDPSQNRRDTEEGRGTAQDQTSGVEHGYGQGGRTAFGQMIDGGSDMPGRGFGGSNAGGFGQQTQNSQWGQGGMGPMTQGANYSQGGGQFGPTGYQPLPESSGPDRSGQSSRGHQPSSGPDRQGHNAPVDQGRQQGGGSGQTPYGSIARDGYGQNDPAASYGQGRDQFAQSSAGQYGQTQGGPHHDDHEPHYRTWRENQIASHDRDYARWREEQVRKYDEDYKGWRNERHSTFSKEFEGWRSGRGGQAGGSAPGEPQDGRPATAGTFATDAASEKSTYGIGGASASAGAATASSATSRPGYVSRSDNDGRAADPNAVHGANPTLADIADGGSARRQDRTNAEEPKTEAHKA